MTFSFFSTLRGLTLALWCLPVSSLSLSPLFSTTMPFFVPTSYLSFYLAYTHTLVWKLRPALQSTGSFSSPYFYRFRSNYSNIFLVFQGWRWWSSLRTFCVLYNIHFYVHHRTIRLFLYRFLRKVYRSTHSEFGLMVSIFKRRDQCASINCTNHDGYFHHL